jgi:hypothetical protein
MILINEAFDLLTGSGLITTQDGFSRNWLCQSAGYFAYLKSTGAMPSLGSIACLGEKLKEASFIVAGLEPLTDARHRLRQQMFDLGMKLSMSVVREALLRRKTRT